MSSHDVLKSISTEIFVESSEHLHKSLLQRLTTNPLSNYHSVPHKAAARARLKVTISDQHLSAHSHGQASAHLGAMWCQVAPASSFFFFHSVTSNLLNPLWKHNCSLQLSLLVSFQLSPLIRPPSASWDKWLLGDLVCMHVSVCLCMWVWVPLCLIVLCMINRCDSRNVCVTRAQWLESISCLFSVSLVGYHSKTHTHTHTTEKHDSLLTLLALVL